jgi:hypothetical protein
MGLEVLDVFAQTAVGVLFFFVVEHIGLILI